MSQTSTLVHKVAPALESRHGTSLTKLADATDGEIHSLSHRETSLPHHLLSTKIMVPTIPQWVLARPCLLDRLDAGMNGKLTFVSAPAGFGKTTLLATWVCSRLSDKSQVAWVTLEEADNDSKQFWEYVLTAIDRCEPGVCAQALHILRTTEKLPLEQMLVSLINALTHSAPRVTLILDDYQWINEPAIHRSVTFLLDYLPAHVHLVLATRTTPPLPLARLRAGGHLSEIRTEHLRASEEETQAFLRDVMSLPLAPAEIAEITARTEGWLAGLHLLGFCHQPHATVSELLEALSGKQRYIYDYLTEEVLGHLPVALQDFLLETSILSRLCAALCDAVLERTDSQRMLEEIDHANLFVFPLDQHRGWYRYHPLFGESLRARREREANEAGHELCLRASRWYLERGEIDEALHYACSAQAWEFAADVLEGNDPALLWGPSEESRRLRWLEQFPEEVLRARPQLCKAYDQALQSALTNATAGERLATAEGGLIAHELEKSQQLWSERNVSDKLESLPGKRRTLPSALASTCEEQAKLSELQNVPMDARPLQQVDRGTPQLLLDPLSKREQEVLSFMAKGASNQEIAEELVVALCTVKHHVSKILSKLEASNRTQAMARARTLGLLSDAQTS